MLAAVHPEVLASDWLPPVPLFRRGEVRLIADLVRRGWTGDGPRLVALRGPAGSGTSTVARSAVGAAVRDAPAEPGHLPRSIQVRVRETRGAWGVATLLLRGLEGDFTGRGFHPSEIMAGLLRRLQRDARPTVVVLDDIGPGAGDLGLIFRALTEPHRFLPEGDAVPRIVTVVAGATEGLGVWAAVRRLPRSAVHQVELGPYPSEVIGSIVADRATRALGRTPPEAWLAQLSRTARDRGYSSTGAVDLLRRSLATPDLAPIAPSPGQRDPEFSLEPRLLAALQRLERHRRASIAQIRRWEADLATAEGGRPLPATTFWRRIVRLESVGLVHREVRAGGAGGTRSIVELVGPIPESFSRPETRPTAGWTAGPTGPAARPG